jgi:hypothetical protein
VRVHSIDSGLQEACVFVRHIHVIPDIRSIEVGVATRVDAPEQVYGVSPPLKTGLARTSVIFLAMIGQSPSSILGRGHR